jgi:activator of HSP90 ATPase
MPESLEVSATVPASPAEVYASFLDSSKHSAMTGAKASVDSRIGGKFTAWDDYISGTTVALDPTHKITQK